MKTDNGKLRIGFCLACIALLTCWAVARLRAADAAAPKQAPSAWQYQTFDYNLSDVNNGLNDLANSGWEIVSASRYVYGPDSQPMVFVTARILKKTGGVHQPAQGAGVAPAATFSVPVAPPGAPLYYQWRFNSNAVPPAVPVTNK